MISNEDGETPIRRTYWLLAILVLLAFVSAYLWWPSWKTFPEVSSRESLQLLKQLYTACNTRSPERLQQVEIDLKKLIQQGKVGDAEQKAYLRLVALAQSGQWEEAARASLRFAQDQVR